MSTKLPFQAQIFTAGLGALLASALILTETAVVAPEANGRFWGPFCGGTAPNNDPSFFKTWYTVADSDMCHFCCQYPASAPDHCRVEGNPCNYPLTAENCSSVAEFGMPPKKPPQCEPPCAERIEITEPSEDTFVISEMGCCGSEYDTEDEFVEAMLARAEAHCATLYAVPLDVDAFEWHGACGFEFDCACP